MISSVLAPPICTVRISGGLGNQMFQYAAGRTLAIRHDSRLKLDTSFYGRKRHRRFELGELPIVAEFDPVKISNRFISTGRRFRDKLLRDKRRSSRKVYSESQFHYDQVFAALPSGTILDGYFQSERYFREQADTIVDELTPRKPNDARATSLAGRIAGCEATALHVRRGDYVTSAKASQIYCTCDMDYYRDALELIPGDDPVFVFSDDIAWAKENLPQVKPLVFPEPAADSSALTDLWLMTHATHHIIANSTFSWWGAYLAGSQKGVTVAPKRWFTDETINDNDLMPANWIRI